MLRIDKRGDSAGGLCLRDNVQGERRFAARLGSEHLDDTTSWHPFATERHIE